MAVRNYSATADKIPKPFSQTRSEIFFAFRDFAANNKFFRHSIVYSTIAKFCEYRLGIVMDIDKPSRPSILDELIILQNKYSTLLVTHGKCQEDYMNKCTEYDNAKSSLLMRVQPSMEKARSTYYSVKGKFDDAKEHHLNLQQQIQVRKDAQKAQMEYENLKIEIQEGYMADVEKEILKNNEAIRRGKEVYGEGDLLREIMPRLQEIGQKAESRKKSLMMSIEEMKRLRDKIAERNAIEESRDVALLKASGDPMAALDMKTNRALQSYETEKNIFADQKEHVDILEREKNQLASEMASMASKISLIVNTKFDISQDIADYNVSLSTIITFINLLVATVGMFYHSYLRAGTKSDVENFIASVKRETDLEKEVSADMKELLKQVSSMQDAFMKMPPQLASGALNAHRQKDEECQTIEADKVTPTYRTGVKDHDDTVNKSHEVDIEHAILTTIDDVMSFSNAPAICFAGVVVLFKCLVMIV